MVLTIFYLSFNQDYSCFSVGTSEGFRVFNCKPFSERFGRSKKFFFLFIPKKKIYLIFFFEEFEGGIGIVEILYKSNILGLVGSGINPKFPRNKFLLWDDFQNRHIKKIKFPSEIKSIKLKKERFFVVLDKKIYVFNFTNLQQIHQIETAENKNGICSVSSENNVFVCLGLRPGFVRIELYDSNQTKIIQPHDTSISQIVLNNDGTRVATTSDRVS